MDIAASFALVFTPEVIFTFFAASIFGLFVGIVPGLSATLATALLVPLTFFMSPIVAITAIISCSAMAIYSGDITGALLRIPGTSASAAYVEDSYQLMRKGRIADALGGPLLASAIGGVIGTIVLIVAAPSLAHLALNFSSYEYFWLVLLGLSAGVLVSPNNPYKALASLGLGLLMSAVGRSLTGQPRFTFGVLDLQAGVSLVAVLIGAFAVAELMRKAEAVRGPDQPVPHVRGNVVAGQFMQMWHHRIGVIRSSLMGVIVGMVPGAGCDVASWISYAFSKRLSKTPEKFGKGHEEGVIEASASNNSALSGAFVPTLVFGVPGDALTAIVVGVLLIKGITPGPSVFVESAELVNALFIVFMAANILMVPLGIAAIYASRNILAIPTRVLYPLILVLCVVGAYASNNTIFDLWVIVGSGVAVWLLNRFGFPAAPVVLGLVLGALLETHFYSSMLKARGSILPFFDRPIGGTLGLITVFIWCTIFLWRPLYQIIRLRNKARS